MAEQVKRTGTPAATPSPSPTPSPTPAGSPSATPQTGVTSSVMSANPMPSPSTSPLQDQFDSIRSILYGGDRSEQKAMDDFLRAHPEFLPQVGGIDWSKGAGAAASGPSPSPAPSAVGAVGATGNSGAAQVGGAEQAPSAAPTQDSSLAGSTAPDSAALKVAAGSPVTKANVEAYLQAALQPRPGQYSDRPLGNSANLAFWTPDKVAELQKGIQTAQQFYPNIPPQTLAKLIIAEGSQESTGDPSAGIAPGQTDFSKDANNSAGLGFLQVTPKFPVQDFVNHGTAIKAPDGSTVVDPNGPIDLANPAVNVALWAWYTRNAVAAGESLNEVAMGQKGSPVTRDFGNAQWSWLGGPHNDRHDPNTSSGYDDYHARIKDYFVQSGFGSADEFESLLNTPVAGTLANTTLSLAGS